LFDLPDIKLPNIVTPNNAADVFDKSDEMIEVYDKIQEQIEEILPLDLQDYTVTKNVTDYFEHLNNIGTGIEGKLLIYIVITSGIIVIIVTMMCFCFICIVRKGIRRRDERIVRGRRRYATTTV
jgi:hypothetical protein